MLRGCNGVCVNRVCLNRECLDRLCILIGFLCLTLGSN